MLRFSRIQTNFRNRKSIVDIGGGEDGIRDIRLGNHPATAKNKITGQPLQIHLTNKGTCQASLTEPIEAGLAGITQ